jgi:hypothetical protein
VASPKNNAIYILEFSKAPCDGGESFEVNAADMGILDLINLKLRNLTFVEPKHLEEPPCGNMTRG